MLMFCRNVRRIGSGRIQIDREREPQRDRERDFRAIRDRFDDRDRRFDRDRGYRRDYEDRVIVLMSSVYVDINFIIKSLFTFVKICQILMNKRLCIIKELKKLL